MKALSIVSIIFTGCLQQTEPSVSTPIGFYQGYAIISSWNPSAHEFQPVTLDSIGAQIRVSGAGDELTATVSINGQAHPFDIFLFVMKEYYTGNDHASYAYFRKDYHELTWGRRSEIDTNLYETIYAVK